MMTTAQRDQYVTDMREQLTRLQPEADRIRAAVENPTTPAPRQALGRVVLNQTEMMIATTEAAIFLLTDEPDPDTATGLSQMIEVLRAGDRHMTTLLLPVAMDYSERGIAASG